MKALLGTVAVSSVIQFIIVGVTVFSQVSSFSGVGNGINDLINAQNLNTITVLLGMILIFLGCFVESVQAGSAAGPKSAPFLDARGRSSPV